MRIDNDPKLDFSDVLIRPKRSTLTSRKDVSLFKTYTFRNSKYNWAGVPIIAANMDHTGTIEMAEALTKHRMSVALHKHYPEYELTEYFNTIRSNIWYSLGTGDEDVEKLKHVQKLTDGGVMAICIDVANGYSERFIEFVAQMRETYPNAAIMAGNVVTGDIVEQLILAGADVVKIGIGPGSVCTTRKVAGVGYPQLSAVIECADAAHGLGGHVCADGGCTTPGDVAKAFGAGADFVMLGGMLAGHDECDGEEVFGTASAYDSETGDIIPSAMKFYGMSSKAAMDKYAGGVAEYRASEGKEVVVPYRGAVEGTVREILGGVRSACTYTGSNSLKELPKRTTFIMVGQTHNTVYGE